MAESNLEPRFHFQDMVELKPDKRKNRLPSLYTDEVKRKILTALGAGCSRKVAAEWAGISKPTLERWIGRGQAAGEDSDGPDHDMFLFSQACLQASSKGAVFLIKNIMKHAEQDGHVAIKALTTLYPEEYGQKSKVTHEIEGEVKVKHSKVDLSNASDEELERLESMATKFGAGDVIDAEIVDDERE